MQEKLQTDRNEQRQCLKGDKGKENCPVFKHWLIVLKLGDNKGHTTAQTLNSDIASLDKITTMCQMAALPCSQHHTFCPSNLPHIGKQSPIQYDHFARWSLLAKPLCYSQISVGRLIKCRLISEWLTFRTQPLKNARFKTGSETILRLLRIRSIHIYTY